MEQHSIVKKKKRRTRKCLDEIRKRSRRHNNENCELGNKLHGAKEPKVLNSLVTMNRLTLNMFPKAIRSETITRPLLEDHSCNMDSNKDMIKIPDHSSVGPATQCFDPVHSAASDNSMPFFTLDDNNVEDNLCIKNDLELTDYLNSHSSRNKQHNPTMQNATDLPSSLTLDNSEEIQFHEKIMDEITSYLDSLTPELFKAEFFNQTKRNICKLLNVNKAEYNASNDQMIDGVHVDLKDPIVENPLDYLRLKHVDKEATECDMNSSASTLAAAFSRHSPNGPLTTTSAHSQCTMDKEAALYETPEYKYYPHRLN